MRDGTGVSRSPPRDDDDRDAAEATREAMERQYAKDVAIVEAARGGDEKPAAETIDAQYGAFLEEIGVRDAPETDLRPTSTDRLRIWRIEGPTRGEASL